MPCRWFTIHGADYQLKPRWTFRMYSADEGHLRSPVRTFFFAGSFEAVEVITSLLASVLNHGGHA